jgi:hypothetical protein
MGRCAVHKNLNSALPNFVVIALCSFLHFELCLGHYSETIRGINKKLCRLIDRIDLKCSARNNNSALPNFGVITLRDITLKLQEVYFPVSISYSGSITRLKPGSCLFKKGTSVNSVCNIGQDCELNFLDQRNNFYFTRAMFSLF